MPDIPEAVVKAALAAAIAWQKEAREALWRLPSHRQVEATIRAQYERAEAAEARLDEIRRVIGTYFTVHGNNTAASLTGARDLAEGIRQVLDRVPLGTQERGDEKGADRGH